ncbi:MAG: iron donor protein CyaY [Gammaproteobacteria bacterium]|nr:iron donor protein CyaY [Gammaproteobacteria bacterium]
MNESEFNRLAEKLLIEIEEAIEVSGADIDYDTAGDILTLEFANASQIIINKQTPLSQIWVAARSGGFHFDYDEDQQVWYLDADRQRDLYSQLSLYCSQQAGESIQLQAPAHNQL